MVLQPPSLLELFRALADPTRMRIVQLLRTMELAVGEVAQVITQSQPRVSRHIRILAEAGLVERRKEGNWVFLRIGGGLACQRLMQIFDDIPVNERDALWQRADLARLAAVRADRVRAADAYFAKHASEWDALRSLHIPEDRVESAIHALVDRLAPKAAQGHVLDIGTGTGRMVELFGPAAQRVTAIDRSPETLRLARAKLPASDGDPASVGKYDLLLGDISDLPLADGCVNFIICHQVLHYAQDPAVVIAEAARVLAEDGCVLIADFAPHDREELRLRDQHARLGFSDEQIAQWFATCGLATEAVEALPGGDLTVKLWMGRRKGARVLPIRGKQDA